MAKYDSLGKNYNQTRKADAYIGNQLFEMLRPKINGIYADIGCGTGNYTIALYQKRVQFIGVDPSDFMLQQAKQKSQTIKWLNDTAENTGLKTNSIDGMIATLTIHHWQNLNSAFSELKRVLKLNGQIVIFTSRPVQMKGYWLNHYFPKMLEASIQQIPALAKVEETMHSNGFQIIQSKKYFVQPDLQDQFLYCGKQNPKLYLDKNIRNGISSFSSLANRVEIKKGLAHLQDDITKWSYSANHTILLQRFR